jgi:voltage-gated potassium channel
VRQRPTRRGKRGSCVEPNDVDERSQRIQRRLEWPVVVAALLTIPLLVIEESNSGDPWQGLATALNWASWSVFFLEVVVMLWVVPRRWEWIKSHPIDLAVAVLTPPFAPAAWQAARVFRLLRLLRLGRAFSIRRLLSLQGVKYAALMAVGAVLVGGAVFASVESDQGLSSWDGIWWAVSTVTTVGYGDVYPQSDAGRIIAMTIMLVGIGFVALLTAFIADRFIREQEEVEAKIEAKEDVILAQLREIAVRLDRLERGRPPAPE